MRSSGNLGDCATLFFFGHKSKSLFGQKVILMKSMKKQALEKFLKGLNKKKRRNNWLETGSFIALFRLSKETCWPCLFFGIIEIIGAGQWPLNTQKCSFPSATVTINQ